MRLVRRYLPLALLLLVAAYQMWRVETDGLTRWRGGGFGMYSMVHYTESQLWVGVQSPRGLQYSRLVSPPTPEGRVLAPRCQIFPTEASLEELSKHLLPRVRTVQIWRPRLDTETLELDRELMAEFER